MFNKYQMSNRKKKKIKPVASLLDVDLGKEKCFKD